MNWEDYCCKNNFESKPRIYTLIILTDILVGVNDLKTRSIWRIWWKFVPERKELAKESSWQRCGVRMERSSKSAPARVTVMAALSNCHWASLCRRMARRPLAFSCGLALVKERKGFSCVCAASHRLSARESNVLYRWIHVPNCVSLRHLSHTRSIYY